MAFSDFQAITVRPQVCSLLFRETWRTHVVCRLNFTSAYGMPPLICRCLYLNALTVYIAIYTRALTECGAPPYPYMLWAPGNLGKRMEPVCLNIQLLLLIRVHRCC